MAEYVKVREVKLPSFIKKKHELDKLHKLVGRETEAAVKVLADAMNDPDEDKSVRRSCAKTLIELKVAIAESINRDSMQRLIAEIKIAPNGAKNLEADDSRPVLDFHTIKEIE